MADETDLPHAVVSTGSDSTPLPGGRSRLTVTGVPILELNDSLVAKVAEAQRLLLDPDEETALLTGAVCVVHNPRPQYTVGADLVTFHIGGETLDEAAKSIIGAFEGVYSHEPPTWVACTDDDLAEILADHYGCPIKGMDEELSA